LFQNIIHSFIVHKKLVLSKEERMDATKRIEASTKNMSYFWGNIESLKQQYPDQWVAIHDGKVIASSSNYPRLIRKVYAQYGKMAGVFFIEFVHKGAIPPRILALAS